jgi:hypothetical protein
LGTVQEQRAGQDGEQHDGGAERGAAVHPGGRAQTVGWAAGGGWGCKLDRVDAPWGWSSVGRRCLIQPYPIKRVISDNIAFRLAAGNPS